MLCIDMTDFIFGIADPLNYIVVFCFVLVLVGCTHILQGYFTSTGAIIDCPSAGAVTLKDMGKNDGIKPQ